MQDIADLDALSEQLAQSYPGARMDDIDLDALARLLGDEAAVDARALSALEQALRDSGKLQRASDGALRLTPRAMRQLGPSLLRDIASGCPAGRARETCARPARPGSRSGSTREWAFGDTEAWDIPRTVTNALHPHGAEGRPRRGHPARDPRCRGGRDRGANSGGVALLVDTSFSMAMDGRWVPMKRTALALHHPDHQPVPRRQPAADRVRAGRRGHGDRAAHRRSMPCGRRARTCTTPCCSRTGTSGGIPTRSPCCSSSPTASRPRTWNRAARCSSTTRPTLSRSPSRCASSNGERLGAQTTFFRLGDDPGLARFIDSLARRAGGNVVAPGARRPRRRGRRIVPRFAFSRIPVRLVPRHVRQQGLVGRVGRGRRGAF